jgi:hypothetical protein
VKNGEVSYDFVEEVAVTGLVPVNGAGIEYATYYERFEIVEFCTVSVE